MNPTTLTPEEQAVIEAALAAALESERVPCYCTLCAGSRFWGEEPEACTTRRLREAVAKLTKRAPSLPKLRGSDA